MQILAQAKKCEICFRAGGFSQLYPVPKNSLAESLFDLQLFR